MSGTISYSEELTKDGTTKAIIAEEVDGSFSDNDVKFHYDAEERKHRLVSGPKWRDILMLICSGFALISDGYQNSVMTMLNTVFALQYPKIYTTSLKTQVSNASLIGTIFGQLTAGIATDYMGRKWSIVAATVFVVLGTLLCAAAHGTTTTGMFWMIIVCRGITGFGVGAEYPSSSVSANEAANESIKRRGGAFVMVTNFPLSIGGPFALCIFLIVHQITKNNYTALWRTMFALGCFWPLSVFYFRMKMVTSELYRESAIRKRVPYLLVIKYYWPRLIGTCGCWFLFDFVTFPNGTFSATIIKTILPGNTNLDKIAEWTLLLSLLSIPGIFIGAYLCDIIGRKYTLMLGFSGYIVFGLIVGCAWEKVSKITGLFVVLYGLMNMMGNLGPGNMMGLTSSEAYATPVRGTCYGIAAALGKVGATVGTQTFTPIQVHLGIKWTFIVAAICGLIGVLLAYFFVPHLTESDLMEEDIKFKNYLLANGWDGDFGVAAELEAQQKSETL